MAQGQALPRRLSYTECTDSIAGQKGTVAEAGWCVCLCVCVGGGGGGQILQ